MNKYDPAKPFCLCSTPSAGVSQGQRGGMIHYNWYATLKDAIRAIRDLESGYSASHITYGSDLGKVVWPA
jgi:hypothetical protein